MNKPILLIAATLIFSVISLSFLKKPSGIETKVKAPIISGNSTVKSAFIGRTMDAKILSEDLFKQMQLDKKGLSKTALETAVKGYMQLKKQGRLKKDGLLPIVDLSQSSRKKRFYLVDVENMELLAHTYVSHGKNSGVDMAKEFSNIVGSEKSSIGFYVTKNTYWGKNGLSLRMAGQEKNFNDNAEKRAIVVHGADYVNAGRVNSSFMGRSQGCPALPRAETKKVINLIKDGTALFVYYPSDRYLQDSHLING